MNCSFLYSCQKPIPSAATSFHFSNWHQANIIAPMHYIYHLTPNISQHLINRLAMLSNPSLQPWFEYDSAISSAPAPVTDPLTALPPIQPCYGGSIGGQAVNCSAVCDYSYLLFDPQHLSNLVTCGLWASVTAGLVQNGQIPTTTPFDAVSLNISGIDNTGTRDGSLSIYDAPLLESFVACFASFYAATHSLTNNHTSTPNTCSATALFHLQPYFTDLCAPRTLDADLGGTGVCFRETPCAAVMR